MTTRIFTLLAIVSLATACGSSDFGGNSGKSSGDIQKASASGNATAKQPATASSTAAKGDGKGSLDDLAPPENPTPEQDAIGKCLKAWGNSPFDKSVYSNYRTIAAAVTVFGGGGYAVQDDQPTDGPALVVVKASVSVLGSANYLLMNPKGWYCIMTDVNVESSSEIDLQCTAHLASNQVQVNVGSTADNTGAVGVNVFSNVKVLRKKDKDSAGGC